MNCTNNFSEMNGHNKVEHVQHYLQALLNHYFIMSHLHYIQRKAIASRVLKEPTKIHFCQSGLTCIAQFLNTLGCLYSCTHNILRQGKSLLFFLLFQIFSVVSLCLSFYLNFAILILKTS